MTRLTDLPPAQAKRLAEVECPDFMTRPGVEDLLLAERRIAIVSSAGLFRRDSEPFRGRDADYRVIPGDIKWPDLLTSHISVLSSLHLYRAPGSTFRSYEMDILGLPIASAMASTSPRSEHRLPSDNSAKRRRPRTHRLRTTPSRTNGSDIRAGYTTGDKNMTNTTAANGKAAAYFGVPWEDAYGYAQAIKVGNTIHVSGQLSHDDKGTLIAPAALDESGKPADFSMMEEQMRVTYTNAAKLLARFGATLDHVGREALCPRCRCGVCGCGQGAQRSLRHGAASVREQSDWRIEAGLS